MIRVLLFGRLGDAAGETQISLPWQPGFTTVETVRAHLVEKSADLHKAFGDSDNLVAVNQRICDPDSAIRDGDEIAFMPPVTGG